MLVLQLPTALNTFIVCSLVYCVPHWNSECIPAKLKPHIQLDLQQLGPINFQSMQYHGEGFTVHA